MKPMIFFIYMLMTPKQPKLSQPQAFT